MFAEADQTAFIWSRVCRSLGWIIVKHNSRMLRLLAVITADYTESVHCCFFICSVFSLPALSWSHPPGSKLSAKTSLHSRRLKVNVLNSTFSALCCHIDPTGTYRQTVMGL